MKGFIISALKLMDKCKKDNIGAYAAQTALFLLMSLVPLVIFFIALVQYTPITKAMLLQWIDKYMPGYLEPMTVTVLDEVYSNSVGRLSTAVLVAVWSAGKGMHCLANGLDVVHGVAGKRNWVFMRIKAVFSTFLFLTAIIALMLLVVFGHLLENFLMKYVPMIGIVVSSLLEVRILIVFPVMILFFLCIYYGLPNRREIHKDLRLKDQLPGAVLCTVCWYLLSVGISVYVSYFNGFSMYGSLTTIVLLMFWLYFCMYLLLFSAELNEVFYDEITSFWYGLKRG